VLSALVLTPSPAAPGPAHAPRVTGYDPRRSGVLGDKQTAHFTIEEIPCISSCSNHSPEPAISQSKLLVIICALHAHPSHLSDPSPLLCMCLDTVRPCYALWTLVQSVLRLTLNGHPAADLFGPLVASIGSLPLRHAPRILPTGLSGISGRSAAATLPCSPAEPTAVQHCLHRS
jgi:hypothetical protein